MTNAKMVLQRHFDRRPYERGDSASHPPASYRFKIPTDAGKRIALCRHLLHHMVDSEGMQRLLLIEEWSVWPSGWRRIKVLPFHRVVDAEWASGSLPGVVCLATPERRRFSTAPRGIESVTKSWRSPATVETSAFRAMIARASIRRRRVTGSERLSQRRPGTAEIWLRGLATMWSWSSCGLRRQRAAGPMNRNPVWPTWPDPKAPKPTSSPCGKRRTPMFRFSSKLRRNTPSCSSFPFCST